VSASILGPSSVTVTSGVSLSSLSVTGLVVGAFRIDGQLLSADGGAGIAMGVLTGCAGLGLGLARAGARLAAGTVGGA
jgi:hypothetical protein